MISVMREMPFNESDGPGKYVKSGYVQLTSATRVLCSNLQRTGMCYQ